jgi:deazaflavin-dependent oxidoreductase (nitroreductase family)
MAETQTGEFLRPGAAERVFNRLFGWMVGAGIGSRHYSLLQVKGRKSGKIYSAPVDVLFVGDRKYLVCPRGRAQWVRNAEASGQVWLKKGSERRPYAIPAVPESDKPELLREYLDRFKLFVQRYFPVPAGSPSSAFVSIAERYPVFELLASDEASNR